jgi:hypothetical protein
MELGQGGVLVDREQRLPVDLRGEGCGCGVAPGIGKARDPGERRPVVGWENLTLALQVPDGVAVVDVASAPDQVRAGGLQSRVAVCVVVVGEREDGGGDADGGELAPHGPGERRRVRVRGRVEGGEDRVVVPTAEERTGSGEVWREWVQRAGIEAGEPRREQACGGDRGVERGERSAVERVLDRPAVPDVGEQRPADVEGEPLDVGGRVGCQAVP